MDCVLHITGSPSELSEIAAELEQRRSSRAEAPAATVAPRRFIKLDEAGDAVPDKAKRWDAVFDRKTGLIWTAGNVDEKGVKWAEAKVLAAGVKLLGQDDWRLPEVH